MLTYNDLVKPSVLEQPIYQPGRPIELVALEFGLTPNEVIKLASNENPLGGSPKALEAAKETLASIAYYPENDCYFLREKLARIRNLVPEQLIFGARSNEIIQMLGHAFIEPGIDVIMGKSAFISYKLFTLLFGGNAIEVPLIDYTHDLKGMAKAITSNTKLVFLPSPNNPTGTWNEEIDIFNFIHEMPDHIIFVYDEAYVEYINNPPDLKTLIAAGKKIICLRTISKIYGLAGFRVGYGYGNVELIDLLNRVRPPFNVSSIAQTAALAALDDNEYIEKCRVFNQLGMKQLEEGLTSLGYEVIPSRANFLLVRFQDSDNLYKYLQAKGVIVRPLKGYNLEGHIRISVGTEEQNYRVLSILNEYENKRMTE